MDTTPTTQLDSLTFADAIKQLLFQLTENQEEVKENPEAKPILDARKLFMISEDEVYRFIWENVDFDLAFEEDEHGQLPKAMEFRYWAIMEPLIYKDVATLWANTFNYMPASTKKRMRLKEMSKKLRKNPLIKFNIPTIVINKILENAYKSDSTVKG